MMGRGLFLAGLAAGLDDEKRQQQQQTAAMGMNVAELRTEVQDLREHIGRMALMNQALWELLRDKLGLSDDDLVKFAQQIDLRDGVADGKMTDAAVRCPQCGRVSNSRHGKCLYCGQQFAKPAMA